jgi:hypothetical protein
MQVGDKIAFIIDEAQRSKIYAKEIKSPYFSIFQGKANRKQDQLIKTTPQSYDEL